MFLILPWQQGLFPFYNRSFTVRVVFKTDVASCVRVGYGFCGVDPLLPFEIFYDLSLIAFIQRMAQDVVDMLPLIITQKIDLVRVGFSLCIFDDSFEVDDLLHVDLGLPCYRTRKDDRFVGDVVNAFFPCCQNGDAGVLAVEDDRMAVRFVFKKSECAVLEACPGQKGQPVRPAGACSRNASQHASVDDAVGEKDLESGFTAVGHMGRPLTVMAVPFHHVFYGHRVGTLIVAPLCPFGRKHLEDGA